MIYLIAALVACLLPCIAHIVWLHSTVRTLRARGEAIAANAASERVTARQRAETDGAIIAEAHSIINDPAARGKDKRWKPWRERATAWADKAKTRRSIAANPHIDPLTVRAREVAA